MVIGLNILDQVWGIDVYVVGRPQTSPVSNELHDTREHYGDE